MQKTDWFRTLGCGWECMETLRSKYPKGLAPKNKSHQALSSLYDTWVRDQCDCTYVDNTNCYYGALMPSTIDYIEQRNKVTEMASSEQFQKDCQKITPQICQSGLPKIFEKTGHIFLQTFCKDSEK